MSMSEHSADNAGEKGVEYLPEQSNLIDYSVRLVENQSHIYNHRNLKQVTTSAPEKLRRFVTGIGQFKNPIDYMQYVRMKPVPKEVYKMYLEDDQEYTRIITASYATDDKGKPTDTLTGLSFTKELSDRYLANGAEGSRTHHDHPLVIDLLDPALFVKDSDDILSHGSEITDVSSFVNRNLAARIDVKRATKK